MADITGVPRSRGMFHSLYACGNCSSYGIISACSWAVGFPVVPSSQNPAHWCYHRTFTVSNEYVVSNPPCKVPQVEQTSNQYLTHVWLCLATNKLPMAQLASFWLLTPPFLNQLKRTKICQNLHPNPDLPKLRRL